MWHLLVATMLALTVISEAKIKCPTSRQCDCIPQLREDLAEVTCHREDNRDANILLVHIEVNNNMVFQCNPNMLWIDYNLLDGLSVGHIESIMFSFCPVPNNSFLKFLQSFNISQPTKFTYHHTNISNTLDRSQFTGLVNLSSLSLNSCGITGLPADIFLDLSKLMTLDLRDNNIELPLHIFDHLSNLQILELGHNNLSHLEKGIFQNLTNLRVLNLWTNRLENLSREIFTGLSKVEYLELSFNMLTSLPVDVFAEMPNIKEISLNGNMFTSLPEGLFSSIPLVKKIKLNNNRESFLELPSRLLASLTNLEEVYLNMCGLTSLPEDIFWGSTEIKNLSLQENVFRTLPEKLFKDSTKLVFLDLSNNKLEELPDSVFNNLQSLKILNLGHNQLTNITRNLFRGTREVDHLNIEHNKLQNIARSAFSYFKKLTHLHLSNNQLTMRNEPFHNSVLNDCTNLEELYLAHNNITTIFDDWSNTMINLHNLDLKYNAISTLTVIDLHFLSTSITVDLTYNNISVIYLRDQYPPSVYRTGNSNSPPIHRSFKLEGNPIICDCWTYHLLLYLEHKMDPEVYDLYQLVPGNLTCTGPSYLKDVPVNELHSEKLECSLALPEICPKPCTCNMRPADSALRVYCVGKQLTEVPQLPKLNQLEKLTNEYHLTLNHTELLLSKNKIKELPTYSNPGYSQVTKLYLSHNNISTLSAENLPPLIKEIELDNNNLTQLNESVLNAFVKAETGLQRVTLHGNPWHCDCKARGLLNFLQQHYTRVPHISNVTCNDDSGRALHNLTVTELCPTSSAGIITASVLVALLGITIGVLAALNYYYHHEVKVWLFAHGWCLWFITEEELDKDKLYDAFISYSHRDEEFVVNDLVPQLESGQTPFKLCLHYRDWIAGEWIPNQIARSVDDSKRTLVVLSPSFLESVWGRMEFRAAHSQALSEGRARVIVVLYGDVGPLDQLDQELRAYLSMNTYVKWGDPWFWDKLRYALPHPQNQRKKTIGIELKTSKTNDGKLELTNHSTPPAATTPPTETIKNPLETTKVPITMAINGHATLLAEANGHVNKCFVKSV